MNGTAERLYSSISRPQQQEKKIARANGGEGPVSSSATRVLIKSTRVNSPSGAKLQSISLTPAK
jgi:hypothetical protein